ncbi:Regulator of cell cycle RGCC [Liparis tanakae]|uniref:Regulator of cell cycle RGCC n=1 Tax=Liparis tanakae TaxID=230148 RepID=A0A4Z2INQ8_9TELE|nr:Regulator of cell cycle RGCC [Liparis tanakae]
MKSPKLKPQARFVHEEDLDDVLCEFDAVMEDFTSPVEKRHFRYDEHLKTMKRRSSASVSDSGISDSEKNHPTGYSWTSRRLHRGVGSSHALLKLTRPPAPGHLAHGPHL